MHPQAALEGAKIHAQKVSAGVAGWVWGAPGVRGLMGRLWDYSPCFLERQFKYYVFVINNIIFMVLYYYNKLVSG